MKIGLVPIGVEFSYDNTSQRRKFYKKLYGHTDYSYYGKYTYKKPGLLSEIPYIKKSESTLIVRREDRQKIKDFLRKNKARFTEHLVLLNEKEARKLKISKPNYWQKLYEDLKGSENLLVTVDF